VKKIAALALVFASCKCGKKPEPPPLEHVTELVIEDAGSHAFEAAPPGPARTWIRFKGPPFKEETPMHGGPDWDFETDLPAIDADGNIALAYDATNDLSNVPNLAVRTMAPDGHVVATTWLLEVSEFDKALADPSRKTAFAALAPIVEKRVQIENAALDADRFTPLEKCTITPMPYDNYPPCSMVSQTITCGSVEITYARQTLDLDGVKKSFPKWKSAALKTGYGPMPVAECFADAWVEPKRKVFVGDLSYLCQGGGDWCTVDPEWRIVPW
jgi:hypothetical protein